VAELIKPLEEAAAQQADEAVAAAPDLDEAGKAALRKQILDEADRTQILPRPRRARARGLGDDPAAGGRGDDHADGREPRLPQNILTTRPRRPTASSAS
jgi:hypothetical protein